MLNFNNVQPADLSWLTREQIIEAICNTFPSKVINDDPNWTVVESEWCVIDKKNNLMYGEELLSKKFKIYFHIYNDDFFIIRSMTREHLAEYVDLLLSEYPEIKNEKTDYTNGNQFSTILTGRKFFGIMYSEKPTPRGKQMVIENRKSYLMWCMCGTDPHVDGKMLAYYSDLLIGSNLRSKYKNE